MNTISLTKFPGEVARTLSLRCPFPNVSNLVTQEDITLPLIEAQKQLRVDLCDYPFTYMVQSVQILIHYQMNVHIYRNILCCLSPFP